MCWGPNDQGFVSFIHHVQSCLKMWMGSEASLLGVNGATKLECHLSIVWKGSTCEGAASVIPVRSWCWNYRTEKFLFGTRHYKWWWVFFTGGSWKTIAFPAREELSMRLEYLLGYWDNGVGLIHVRICGKEKVKIVRECGGLAMMW